jgi:hypothetical protein
MFSIDLTGFEIGFLDQFPQNRRLAMNEFRAQFDNFLASVSAENSSADSIPRLHDAHAHAG